MNTQRRQITLEEWLRSQLGKTSEFDICVSDAPVSDSDGEGVTVIIHPSGVDGDTVDFLVKGNQVYCITEEVVKDTDLSSMKTPLGQGKAFEGM